MTKKDKTPRVGLPPEGYVRVVMDYPIVSDPRVAIHCRTTHPEFPQGSRAYLTDMTRWWKVTEVGSDQAAEGKLIRLIKNANTPEPSPTGRKKDPKMMNEDGTRWPSDRRPGESYGELLYRRKREGRL